MRATCPFCGNMFERSSRALLAERYCNKCIKERILKSGAKRLNKNAQIHSCLSGYIYVK